MNKLWCYSIIFFSGIAFSGCDPLTSYQRVIENNSSHDIWIYTNQNVLNDIQIDSFLIEKNSEKTIAELTTKGDLEEFENCGLADSMITASVVSDSFMVLNKDLNAKGSWSFTVLEEGLSTSGDCECRLSIYDADFQ